MGKGWRFPGLRPLLHFFTLMVGLGIVMAPMGVSLSLLMCYNEHILRLMCYSKDIMRLKVQWKSTCPPSWTTLVLISVCHVFGLCHSFNGCALPLASCFNFASANLSDDHSSRANDDGTSFLTPRFWLRCCVCEPTAEVVAS